VGADAPELGDDEPHPERGGLVLDQEKHLVVGVRQWLLSAQQGIEPQIEDTLAERARQFKLETARAHPS